MTGNNGLATTEREQAAEAILGTPFREVSLGRLEVFVRGYGHSGRDFIFECETFPRAYFKDNYFSIDRTASRDKANRDDFIKRVALYLFDFRRHPEEKTIVFFKRHSDTVFKRATEDAVAEELNELWEFFFQCTPTREVDECARNILRNVREQADVRNRVYQIADGLFFVPDDENALHSVLPEGKDCFFTLEGAFSTLNRSEYTDLLEKSYHDFLGLLLSPEHENLQFKNFYGDLPRSFKWVETWSATGRAGSVERYWDMMVAFSTPFFKKLIERAYLLDGKTRTGKSSYHDVFVFLFGRSNVSEVKIVDFANYHVNNALAYCCVNSPDEEQGGIVPKAACPIFKTFATKRGVSLPVKNKQPIWADGQFMSFHPTNSNLEWPDTESAPCLKRCLIIKFFQNLEYLDLKGMTFAEMTFTEHPEELAKFLGQVFALATYFSRDDKDFFISEQMENASEYVAKETNSLVLYYNYFFKYFDAVSNDDFLWEDYQYACWAFGWTQQRKDAFSRQFDSLLMQKSSPRKIGNKSVRYKRDPRFSSPQVLYPDYEITIADEFAKTYSTPYGNAAQMHRDRLSVVATLHEIEEQRKAAEELKRLERLGQQQSLLEEM